MAETPSAHLNHSHRAGEVSRQAVPRCALEGPSASRPRAGETIVLGGLAAGVLDAIDAMVWVTANGVSTARLFRFIASGLMGMAAFKAGAAGVALGVALHFTIATGAATVYYLLSLKIPLLWRRPLLGGPIFGLGAYIFMHYLVLPLSAVPAQAPLSLLWVANQLFSHTVFVGLPIAVVARRSARERPAARRLLTKNGC